MQSSESSPRIPRRTVLRQVAWTAPAVIVASAAPAFATSGDWMITDFSAAYNRGFSEDDPFEFAGHMLHVSFTIATSGRVPNTSEPVMVVTDADDTHRWVFSAGQSSRSAALVVTPLTSLDATSVTVTVGGQTFGPFPVDRSLLDLL